MEKNRSDKVCRGEFESESLKKGKKIRRKFHTLFPNFGTKYQEKLKSL